MTLILHKVILSLENWKNASKSLFLYYYNDAQKHEGFVGFEIASSRAQRYIIIMSLNYVNFYACYCWWRQFLWRPRMCICKVQKLCINSIWNTFLPVKTCLLLACNTAFYATRTVRAQAASMTTISWSFYFLILYIPVNNFSVMSRWVILGLTSTKQRMKYLAQGQNAVPPLRLELARLNLQSSTLPLSHCTPQVSWSGSILVGFIYYCYTLFYPLCANGFFLLAWYNKLGMWNGPCIYWGVTCYNFQIILYSFFSTFKVPRKKCIWKCRLLKSSAANNCLTLPTN